MEGVKVTSQLVKSKHRRSILCVVPQLCSEMSSKQRLGSSERIMFIYVRGYISRVYSTIYQPQCWRTPDNPITNIIHINGQNGFHTRTYRLCNVIMHHNDILQRHCLLYKNLLPENWTSIRPSIHPSIHPWNWSNEQTHLHAGSATLPQFGGG